MKKIEVQSLLSNFRDFYITLTYNIYNEGVKLVYAFILSKKLMNNQKPFLIAGSIALWVIALSLVFMAGRMNSVPERFDNFDGNRSKMWSRFDWREKMWNKDRNKRQMMNREMQFIDETSLTTEQKSQLDEIKDNQQQEMQNLMQSLRIWSWDSQIEIESQIETLRKNHMAEIRPFVAQDQIEEFDAFVAEGKPQMPRMLWDKWRGMW